MRPAERVLLRDGSAVLLRPIAPDDKEALRTGLERLSPEGRYRRFLMPKKRLGDHELAYLTEIDHQDHEALIAFADSGEPVGVARYVRLPGDRSAAEVAVAVVDDWQGRGIATALFESSSHARRAWGSTASPRPASPTTTRSSTCFKP